MTPAAGTARTLSTPSGPASVLLSGSGPGLLVLGHGAGGGTEAVDLRAAAEAGLAAGFRVALVEQPWRVAGRRVAEASRRLDAVWVAVLTELGGGEPLVVGGRSAGARVACRTAGQVGADAVLCLAFPLHPPARPERSRAGELASVDLPMLVLQGGRDAFGMPDRAVVVAGADHGFRVRRGDPDPAVQIAEAVGDWLLGLARG